MKLRFLLPMLCTGLILPALAQDAARGSVLFQTQCSRCHRDGAAAMRTPATELQTFLADKSVRAHRFRLSETEVQDVIAYLASERATR
ncbi:MAG: c-type cytochrome [Thiobacillus sp.]